MERMAIHGGMCCGITHIQGFDDYGPDDYYPPKVKLGDDQFKQVHTKGHEARTDWSRLFVNEELPQQTGRERLKLLIERITNTQDKTEAPFPPRYSLFLARKHGIIEVVLASDQRQKEWHEVLVGEFGFKLVNEALNSRSGNTMFVYHLNT